MAWSTSTGSAGLGRGSLFGAWSTAPSNGHRTVARRVINELKGGVAHIVVDGLGHAHGHQIQPALAANSATLWAVSMESLPPL